MRASPRDDLDLARRVVAAAGFPTAVVIQVLMNETTYPVILFTVATPDGRRVAATAWLDGPLNDEDVGVLVTPNWDVA